jgi:hypothetical protein
MALVPSRVLGHGLDMLSDQRQLSWMSYMRECGSTFKMRMAFDSVVVVSDADHVYQVCNGNPVIQDALFGIT